MKKVIVIRPVVLLTIYCGAQKREDKKPIDFETSDQFG